jgi:hypothetical protein
MPQFCCLVHMPAHYLPHLALQGTEAQGAHQDQGAPLAAHPLGREEHLHGMQDHARHDKGEWDSFMCVRQRG